MNGLEHIKVCVELAFIHRLFQLPSFYLVGVLEPKL